MAARKPRNISELEAFAQKL